MLFIHSRCKSLIRYMIDILVHSMGYLFAFLKVSFYLFLFIYFYLFRPCHVACRILVPLPGIEPMPPAVEARILNHWTTREVLKGVLWSTTLIKFSVSIHSGCSNEISQTRELLNNRNLCLTVLEAGSPRSGCQHGQVRALFWVADFLF